MLKSIRGLFGKDDVLSRLMWINISVFIGLHIIEFVLLSFGKERLLISLGSDFHLMASSELSTMATRPWSVVTYMFTHLEVGHLIFNLLCLYTSGRIFKIFLTDRQLLWNYLLGGLSGYVLFFITAQLFGQEQQYIVGASAAVVSLIITVGVLEPNFEVRFLGLFEMKLKWLCLLLIVVDLIGITKGFNSGGHIGHLGGALFGLAYAINTQSKAGMASWFDNLKASIQRIFGGSGMRVAVNNGRPKTDDQFNEERAARQKRVDQILDKIGRSGYESLSKEEKDFLFKYSQK